MTVAQLLAAIAAALLTVVGLTTWIAIVTVCASCLTSWTEFAGTSKKLSRYSSAVTALKDIR